MLVPDLPLLLCTCSCLRPALGACSTPMKHLMQLSSIWFFGLPNWESTGTKKNAFIFKSRSTKVYLVSFSHLPHVWSGTHRCCWNIHKWLSHPPWLSESLTYKSLLNRSQCIWFPSRQLTASELFLSAQTTTALGEKLPLKNYKHLKSKTLQAWIAKSLCGVGL